MQVDGSVIMGAFGIVFAAFSGMVGVIWAMLNKRICTVELSLDKIFDELKADRKSSAESDQKILEKISDVHESISQMAIASGDRKAGCIREFATKQEVRESLESVKRGA